MTKATDKFAASLMVGNDFSTPAIIRAIKALGVHSSANNVNGHAIACAILSRALGSNDASLMASLAASLPAGSKQRDFTAWVHAHSNVRIVSVKGVFSSGLLSMKAAARVSDDEAEALLVKAKATPWYAMEKPSKDAADINDEAMIASLKAMVKKYTGDKASINNAALLTILKAAANVVEKAEKKAA